jgi:hypothetical protein
VQQKACPLGQADTKSNGDVAAGRPGAPARAVPGKAAGGAGDGQLQVTRSKPSSRSKSGSSSFSFSPQAA